MLGFAALGFRDEGLEFGVLGLKFQALNPKTRRSGKFGGIGFGLRLGQGLGVGVVVWCLGARVWGLSVTVLGFSITRVEASTLNPNP